jgi:hypothetical protein
MAHSFAAVWLHIVFGTKNRLPFLHDSIRPELHAYVAAVLQRLDCPARLINSVDDHLHALVRLSRRVSIEKVLEAMKANSSRWLKTKGGTVAPFPVAGGLRGVFRQPVPGGDGPALHRPAGGTSSASDVPRGVRGPAAPAWFRLRPGCPLARGTIGRADYAAPDGAREDFGGGFSPRLTPGAGLGRPPGSGMVLMGRTGGDWTGMRLSWFGFIPPPLQGGRDRKHPDHLGLKPQAVSPDRFAVLRPLNAAVSPDG